MIPRSKILEAHTAFEEEEEEVEERLTVAEEDTGILSQGEADTGEDKDSRSAAPVVKEEVERSRRRRKSALPLRLGTRKRMKRSTLPTSLRRGDEVEQGNDFDQISNENKSSTHLPGYCRICSNGARPIRACPRLSLPVHGTPTYTRHVQRSLSAMATI